MTKVLKIPCDISENYYKIIPSAICEISVIFVIKAAEPLDKSIALLKPFSLVVWIFVGVSILFLTLSLFLLFSSEAKIKAMNAPKFFNVFWIVVRCFLRQDIEIESIRLKTKYMIFGIWMLMAFVLSSGYLGILPSFLIFPGEEVIPHNFVQLFEAVKQEKYQIDSIEGSTASLFIWKIVFNEHKNKMYEFAQSHFLDNGWDTLETASDGLQSVLYKKTCLLASTIDIKKEIQAFGPEKFFVSTDILYTEYDYLCMEKPFLYIHEFQKAINIIHQSGIADKLQNDQDEDVRRKREFYEPLEANKDDSLKLEHVIGPIYLLLVGYLLSTLIFIMELVFYYGKNCLSRRKL
ncbi:ionotropic receptor 40a-like [Centruroides sculpturatus]|uniref:ionotropic receptor 40a-like n=1 Tax=Centruroides sculpturatus TaxID=218467 RepID=UPI000C6EC9EF|nr:ionotropic receptor 40a-like [Centruroides sculpturatus]XP_023218993.1 ionotropic receptor 40a-like [Centruroides sculpturatus]